MKKLYSLFKKIISQKNLMIIFCLISIIPFSLNSFAQCPDNLLVNGSFDSKEGENVTAEGWNRNSTPDINDHNGPLNSSVPFVWTGIPLASPNGGTWQNLTSPEYVEQIVNVIPGTSYTFCFEYAAQGITDNGRINIIDTINLTEPVGVIILLDGIPAYTSPNDSTHFTWETGCFSFTPTTTTVKIRIMPTNRMYVGIDGACLQPTAFPETTAIPWYVIALITGVGVTIALILWWLQPWKRPKPKPKSIQ